jgi:hypothetical protein
MQPVSPHCWRALPTALIVVVALALGAAAARADDGSAQAHRVSPPGGYVAGVAVDGGRVAAASTSSAIR